MSSLREALLDYQNSLEELTFNSKSHISGLTMIAADYKDLADGPPNIVNLILKRLETVDADQKLPVLYLIDSIIKNIGDPFKKLFSEKIVAAFKHVFEEGDEDLRMSLYKLRKTWVGHLSNQLLYAIDTVAQNIDPAWPPSNPTSVVSTTHIPVLDATVQPLAKRRKENLDVTSTGKSLSVSLNSTTKRKIASKTSSTSIRKPLLPEKAIAPSSVAPVTLGTLDKDYRKEIVSNTTSVKKRSTLTAKQHSQPQPQPQPQPVPAALPLPPIQAPIQTPIQTPSMQTAINAGSLQQQAQGPMPPMSTINNFASLSLSSLKPSTTTTTTTSIITPESIPQLSKDIGQQYVQVDGNTVKLFFLDENTSIVLMKGYPHLSLNELVKSNPYDLEPRLIMFEGKPTKVYIDSDKNGSSDYITVNFNSQAVTFYHGEHAQRIKLGGPCREIILNGKAYQASFGGPPIEVTFLGDTHSTHSLKLCGPPPRVKISDDLRVDLWTEYVKKITGQSEETPIPTVQTSYSSLSSTTNMSPSLAPLPLPLQAQSLVPSLVPSLSSSLPQVAPSNILGTPSASLLPPQATTSLVPPLQLALSNPPTVLVQPSGPQGLVTNPTNAIPAPIPSATVLGAANLNPLQSCLPLQVGVPVQSSNATVMAPTTESINPGDLINKLISFGMLKTNQKTDQSQSISNDSSNSLIDTISSTVPSNVTTIGSSSSSSLPLPLPLSASSSSSSSSPAFALTSSSIINVPTATATATATVNATESPTCLTSTTTTTLVSSTGSNVTRTDSPSVLIRENGLGSLDEIESEPLILETKSLKADHPKVIADLISGTQCPNCSLRFEVYDSNERSKYSVHLDWHFRLNRQERNDSKSKTTAVRRWFCPLDLWVSFKEVSDDTEEKGNGDIEGEDNDSNGEKKVYTVCANEEESLNECAVCKEKFGTNWNEEEEEWQLLNAVKNEDGKIYHPLCLEDLLNQRKAAEAAAAAAATVAAAASKGEANEAMESTTVTDDEKSENESASKPMEIIDEKVTINNEEDLKTEDSEENKELKEEEKEENNDEKMNDKDDEDEEDSSSSNSSNGTDIENENENGNGNGNDEDEDDEIMIDGDFTIHSAEIKGHLEVSVCCIS